MALRRGGAACAAVVFACATCRPDGDPAYERGSTVVMAVPNAEAVLPDETDLDFLVFLPLAKLNEHGELEGVLARGWEPSPDHKEYTFHLHTDVRWHDGVPVTAHDVKFTLDLLTHPDVAEYAGIEATVVNDSTVRIRAAKPNYLDDIVYYPRHLLDTLAPRRFWQWEFWLRPVGNGPYRFVRHEPETSMEFEANPDYYGGKPRIERVILKFVGEAGVTELLAGNADIAVGDLVQIPRIEEDPRFRVYVAVSPGARAIYWRTDHPLFRDPRVRRALTLAIDRREIARLLNLPADAPVTDAPLTRRQLARGEFPEPLPYDPVEARRLLEAAGWSDADGDGVRERGGRAFRFTADVWNDPGTPQMAVHVQEYLRRVGVRMEIRVLEGGLMWEKLRAGDFEALVMIQQSGYGSPEKRDFGRGNRTGYANPAVFDLLDRIMATVDPAEEDRLYRDLAEIFRAELPVTRIVPWTRTHFVHRRVRGLSAPFRLNPDTHMEELWLEGEGLE
ncbi:MAG: ABC transporter substrate-binding protein [Gemmatimonadota bacterium]